MSENLTNCSSVIGEYAGTVMDMPSNCVTTLLIDVDVTKSADRKVWATGELTYTIQIKNYNGEPITNAKIEDTLDPALIVFVEGSMTFAIGGTTRPTPVHTYDPVSGLLTVELPEIDPGVTVTVTFRVAKKSQP